jgi:transposase InsO family protein
LIGINRLKYYRNINKQKLIAEKVDQVIILVNEVRIKMPRLGGKKLYHLLRISLQALKIGRDKFFDILRSNRLLIKPKRQYHITTDSHHRFKKHKNLVENLEITQPEQVIVSDITYVGNRNYPMYLSLVTDAYSKKIMGYNLSKSLGAQGANSALKMAIKNRGYSKRKLIHHSDRGIQYCCDLYQKTLKKENIQCSMTEQYDPYQNEVAERINGILKQEFLCGIRTNDFDLMKILIDSSIKIYNEERPHFSNFMLTPQQMHKQAKIKMRTYRKQKTEYQYDLVLS